MRRFSTKLTDIPGIAHGFFTREGGVSEGIYTGLNCGPGSGDDPAAIIENRRRLMEELANDSLPLCTLYQIHSPDVVTVHEPWEIGSPPKGDAMVTDRPEIAIGISTADCGPVLFCDPEARVIGAAHAGWKGAIGGVLENTIAAMEALGAQRSRIIAAIGPCIAQDSYEVGEEFYRRFVEENPLYGTFFREGMESKYYFDLPGFICHRLSQSGLQPIDSLAMDTYSDPAFFSYRRTTHANEPDYGRQVSAIMIRNEP